jgi:hypothetical protein
VLGSKRAQATNFEAVLHSKSAAMDGRIWIPPFVKVEEQSTTAGMAIQDGSQR